MDRASMIFCGGSLAASLVMAWLCFPMAALDERDDRQGPDNRNRPS